MRKLIVLLVILIAFLGAWNIFSKYLPQITNNLQTPSTNKEQVEKVKIVKEESIVVDVVKKVGPSVVTVAEEVSARGLPFEFGPFSIFGFPDNSGSQNQTPQEPQNIGSGFIVSKDGLIITNKHVVSDVGAKYHIITSDGKNYDATNIYRDPLNDVALIKINVSQNPIANLSPVVLGDSSKLEVGQFVIAIGTALGEFRNTVTTGVISGLGRGIVAGSQFRGSSEELQNVIQTDAAINPGNSGGPLVNSSGQVIGVNTAVASSGQNIGFALPINVIRDSLKNFQETGQFNRPYLGISYTIISRDIAILNSLPEGAYIQGVAINSPADRAGIKRGDIVVSINNTRVGKDNDIASIIGKKKIGDTVIVTVFRDNKTLDIKATLDQSPNQ